MLVFVLGASRKNTNPNDHLHNDHNKNVHCSGSHTQNADVNTPKTKVPAHFLQLLCGHAGAANQLFYISV